MSSVSTDFATHLASQMGSLTLGTNLFTGPVRMVGDYIPTNCVFAYLSSGFLPRPYMGQNEQFRQAFIEVRVRYERDNFASGADFAHEIYDTMDLSEFLITDSGSRFVWCKPLTAAPTYISTSKDDFHMWSFTFEVGYEKEL